MATKTGGGRADRLGLFFHVISSLAVDVLD
jgi:hypothetical protein